MIATAMKTENKHDGTQKAEDMHRLDTEFG